MSIDRSRPLVRILPFILAGYFAGPYLDATSTAGLLTGMALFFLLAYLSLYSKTWLTFEIRWVYGVVLFISLFLLSAIAGSLFDQRIHPDHYTNNAGSAYLGVLKGDLVRKGKSFRGWVELKSRYDSTGWNGCNGKVLVYFPMEDSARLPSGGERLALFRPLEKVAPPSNPGQFDFPRWLANKQAYRQIRLKHQDYLVEEKGGDRAEMLNADRLRANLLESFTRAGLSGDEKAVVSALVLGADDEVSKELVSAFSASGTLHILSVSGMHVGLVYAALNGILLLLFSGERWLRLRTVLILISIWFYAILTGFSPAVQRAAAMLSLVISGKAFSRSSDTWNLLAGSLLVLLFADPLLLNESGFQLSYAAVAGIIGFYPWLYERGNVPGKWGDLLWKSVCVSMAAQVFTFPLGLYHFHQFPNYFLPANLLIIPLSTAVMFCGIALIFLAPVGILSYWAGWLTSYLASMLNETVMLFDGLPHAQIKGVWLSAFECVLLCFTVVAGTVFLSARSNRWLFTGIAVMIVFLGCRLFRAYEERWQFHAIVYQIPGKSGIGLITGNSAVLYTTLNFPEDDQIFRNAILPGLEMYGVDPAKVRCIKRSENYTGIAAGWPVLINKGCLLAGGIFMTVSESVMMPPKRVEADLLLIGHGYRRLPEAKMLLMENTLSRKDRYVLKRHADKFRTPRHDLRQEGALVLNIRQ